VRVCVIQKIFHFQKNEPTLQNGFVYFRNHRRCPNPLRHPYKMSASTPKKLTFVVNTPIYRELTFKQFKEEFAHNVTAEQAKEIWKRMVEKSTNREFVTEAMTGVDAAEPTDVEDEVNDLITEKMDEAAEEMWKEKEEVEEGEVKEG